MRSRVLALVAGFGLVCAPVFMGCSDAASDDVTPPGAGARSGKDTGGVVLTDLFIYGNFENNFGYQTWDHVEWEWPNVPESPRETLIVVRSEADLDKYSVTCRDILPEVDYSKQALLLIHGATNSGIYAIKKSITLTESGNYLLTAGIIHDCTCWCPVWKTAVIVSNLPPDAEVELKVETLPMPEDI